MRYLIFFLFLLPTLCFAENFRMMTWNVYQLPSPIKTSKQKERSLRQAEELKKIQSELDFVVLNEAFSAPSKRRISEALQEQFPHSAKLPRKGSITKVMDSGVVVFSRYPMKVLGQDYYKKCAKADCFAAKGVMLVEITLPGNKKVQVAATHMQSGGKEKSINVRKTQSEQIKKLLDAHATPGVPQILAGDLNIDALKKEEFDSTLNYLNMETVDETQAALNSKANQTNCMGVEDTDREAWKDHILVNKKNSNTKMTQRYARPIQGMIKGTMCDLSDHHPVVANFDIQNSEEECEIPFAPPTLNLDIKEMLNLSSIIQLDP